MEKRVSVKRKKNRLKNTTDLLVRMVKYNMKIIFAQRFGWFVLVALLVFLLIAGLTVYDGSPVETPFIYGALILPGILLLFYPTAFGIQNDEDARVLEILFGIPNYRYKIWMVRLLIIYVVLYIMLLLFAEIASVTLFHINIFEVSGQLMYPMYFTGMLAFMLSTLIRNGTGTAVVLVVLGIGLFILGEAINRSFWNVFHNPYKMPWRMNEMIWHTVTVKNRIFLLTGGTVFLLTSLLNLQKREKFIR
jgi:uncharacterized integral membrane protein